ncbi:CAP domain-containing protein, partial [Frankia sp. CiP1_Cm_nod1]|uniref:CAP domain-containing protein n=1 Tax=Frankia sp. CiP1_Cm_nod1 TaxID=2897160 RepID=UPI00202414D9
VTPVTSAPSEQIPDEASEVVALTNAERARAGCAALMADRRLTAAAQAHSADMSTRDYFSHDSLDGRTPFQRMAEAGYGFSAAAENIAAGQRTPAEVVRGWMNSAGHRANILNCSLRQIGVGYATGGRYGTYWTQDFGTP